MPDGASLREADVLPLNRGEQQEQDENRLFGWMGGWWFWRPVEWLPPWPQPSWPVCRPSPHPARLAWTVTVQCRDGGWSFNTVLPDWCWWGKQAHTRHVVAALRNGVPCRCFCPPGRCEGKRGVQRHFRPHLPRGRHLW